MSRARPSDQLFAVVAEQVAGIFDVPYVGLVRDEPDGSVVVGSFSEADHHPLPVVVGLDRAWPSVGASSRRGADRHGRGSRARGLLTNPQVIDGIVAALLT